MTVGKVPASKLQSRCMSCSRKKAKNFERSEDAIALNLDGVLFVNSADNTILGCRSLVTTMHNLIN